MNEYEQLVELSESCERMAKMYADNQDTKLCKFYKNASIGFKEKSHRFLICELFPYM